MRALDEEMDKLSFLIRVLVWEITIDALVLSDTAMMHASRQMHEDQRRISLLLSQKIQCMVVALCVSPLHTTCGGSCWILLTAIDDNDFAYFDLPSNVLDTFSRRAYVMCRFGRKR